MSSVVLPLQQSVDVADWTQTVNLIVSPSDASALFLSSPCVFVHVFVCLHLTVRTQYMSKDFMRWLWIIKMSGWAELFTWKLHMLEFHLRPADKSYWSPLATTKNAHFNKSFSWVQKITQFAKCFWPMNESFSSKMKPYQCGRNLADIMSDICLWGCVLRGDTVDEWLALSLGDKGLRFGSRSDLSGWVCFLGGQSLKTVKTVWY